MKTRNKVLMALGTLGIAGASFMGTAHADTIKVFNKTSNIKKQHNMMQNRFTAAERHAWIQMLEQNQNDD